MKSRAGQNGSIQNGLIKSMIYSWDYFDMSFPTKNDCSDTPYYVPNGFIELVFLKNLQVYEASYNEPLKKLPQAFVWGQTKHGNKIVVAGTGSWFEIKIYPWAFELLFGHSALSLDSKGTALNDLNQEFGILAEQINFATNSTQAIYLFEQFAIQQLNSTRTVKPFLIYSFDRLLSSHGQMKISELCSKMNISRQYFHQYFKDKIGLPPKYYAKIVRLRHAVDIIYKQKNRPLTQIALETGYFDQAHFINDFKTILHQAPTSFFEQRQFIYWDL